MVGAAGTERAEIPWEREFVREASEADVYSCFRLLLGRNPSRHEWPAHRGAFTGKPLESVISIYLNSPEFKSRKLLEYSLENLDFVELDGYGLFVSNDDLATGIHIRADRQYEPAVTAVFREILRPGMRVVDVGANVGWFTALSAHIVGPAGRVVSVEAGELNSKLLLMSRLRNGWEQVVVLRVAASDRAETVVYSSNSSNGFVHAARDMQSIAGGALVTALPLDDVLEDGAWNLVKVDVEGYEHKVLLGLERTIHASRPSLLVEFTPPSLEAASGITGTNFLRWITDRGYEITVLASDKRHECGTDIDRVLALYEGAPSDHLDLWARPAG